MLGVVSNFFFVLENSQLTLWCSFHVDREVLSLPYMCIPSPQNSPPPMRPHDVNQNSVWSTVRLCWSFILNRAMCTVDANSLRILPPPNPHHSPMAIISSLCMCVSLSQFCKYVHLYDFFLDATYKACYWLYCFFHLS